MEAKHGAEYIGTLKTLTTLAEIYWKKVNMKWPRMF